MPGKVRIVGRGARREADEGPIAGDKHAPHPSAQPMHRISETHLATFKDDLSIVQAEISALRAVNLLTPAESKELMDTLKVVRDELGQQMTYSSSDSLHRIATLLTRLEEHLPDNGRLIAWMHDDLDHLATRLRMQLRRQLGAIILGIADLQEVLIEQSRGHRTTAVIVPTHGRTAAITSLAHLLLGYCGMFQEDIERIIEAAEACDALPLGSGGGVPHSIPWDRKLMANALSFTTVTTNSYAATFNGDPYVEVATAALLAAQHVMQLVRLLEGPTFPPGSVRLAGERSQRRMPQFPAQLIGLTALNIDVRTHHGAILALSSEAIVDPMVMLSWERHVLGLLESTYLLFGQVNRQLAGLSFAFDGHLHLHDDPTLYIRDVVDQLIMQHRPMRAAQAEATQVLQQQQRAGDASEGEDDEIIPRTPAELLSRIEVLGGPGPKGISKQVVRATAQVARTRRLAPYIARTAKPVREVGFATQAARKVRTDAQQPVKGSKGR